MADTTQEELCWASECPGAVMRVPEEVLPRGRSSLARCCCASSSCLSLLYASCVYDVDGHGETLTAVVCSGGLLGDSPLTGNFPSD